VTYGYWFDASGQAQVEDAMAQSFVPDKAEINRGYVAGASWFKLTLHPSVMGHSQDWRFQDWRLNVQPTYLDDVRLYLPRTDAEGGGWHEVRSGDRIPFAQRELDRLAPTFRLPAPSSRDALPWVAYVRVQSTSTHLVRLQVAPDAALSAQQDYLLLGMGIYAGLALALIVSSAVNGLLFRDHLWLTNAALQMIGISAAFAGIGGLNKYVWPNLPAWADAVFSFTMVFQSFTGHIFSLMLYRNFGAPRWMDLSQRGFIFGAALPFGWLVAGHTSSAMQWNSQWILLGISALIFVWGPWLKVPDRLEHGLLRALFTAYCGYVLFHMFPVLGWGQITWFHLYPALFSNLLTALTLHALLLRHRHVIQEAQRQTAAQAAQAREQLRWEQRQRQEHMSFMSMLLHELKTPLAAIRLSAQSLLNPDKAHVNPQRRIAHIESSVRDIDAVLERCRQVDKLAGGCWQVHRSAFDVATWLHALVAELPARERVMLQTPPTLHAPVDAQLLRIMVMNLLDNALTYAARDTPVAVVLSQPADHLWRLQVSNAVGKVGRPDPTRVFTKYYRAEAAHQYTGSGLGLFLIHQLAVMVAGRLQLLSPVHTHDPVVFVLELPCS
jgi:signal transduction histidine kinase